MGRDLFCYAYLPHPFNTPWYCIFELHQVQLTFCLSFNFQFFLFTTSWLTPPLLFFMFFSSHPVHSSPPLLFNHLVLLLWPFCCAAAVSCSCLQRAFLPYFCLWFFLLLHGRVRKQCCTALLWARLKFSTEAKHWSTALVACSTVVKSSLIT